MKNETIEEAAERHIFGNPFGNFIRGAEWMAERMYSEEDIHNILDSYSDWKYNGKVEETYEKWFKQFKK
jgi:hypothetical protein